MKVNLEELRDSLDVGRLGGRISYVNEGYLTDALKLIARLHVSESATSLLEWGKDNYDYIIQVSKDDYPYGEEFKNGEHMKKGDTLVVSTIKEAQFYSNMCDLLKHKTEIILYYVYDYLLSIKGFKELEFEITDSIADSISYRDVANRDVTFDEIIQIIETKLNNVTDVQELKKIRASNVGKWGHYILDYKKGNIDAILNVIAQDNVSANYNELFDWFNVWLRENYSSVGIKIKNALSDNVNNVVMAVQDLQQEFIRDDLRLHYYDIVLLWALDYIEKEKHMDNIDDDVLDVIYGEIVRANNTSLENIEKIVNYIVEKFPYVEKKD